MFRKKPQHVAAQKNDELRIEFMGEFSYLPAHMIPYVDETGNDRHSDRRKYGYHLHGMRHHALTAKGKPMSAIAIMLECGIEDVDI